MNEEPWWAYTGDEAWKGADGVSVRVVSSSRQLVAIEIVTAGDTARAIWDPQLQALSMLDDKKLDSRTFAVVRRYVQSATEQHTLSEPTLFVLDLLADTLSRDANVSLKNVRQQLMRKFGVKREAATTIVEDMHPRFVALRGDYVTLQPLGLFRSKLGEDAALVLATCLERMKAAYDENADISSIALNSAFGDVNEDRKRLLLREIYLLRLASNISTDGKGTWHVPVDIEELWAENVTTLEAFWRFAKEQRTVPRPWPGALLRGDWKDDRIEKYLHDSALGDRMVSLLAEPPNEVQTSRPEPAPEPRQPEYTLPRLEVSYGDKLGSGAFGTVWQGTDKLLERSIAVKFLTSTAESLDEEALIREARSLAKVAHPNLVTVYSAAWLRHPDNGLVAPAITMELLKGVELERWRERQHERHEVLKVATGILAGIAAMHDADLHHGDLHLQNVMVLSDATAKLIDWRYQDTFLQKSTAYRRDLMEVDRRRAVDLVVGVLEKQGLNDEALLVRKAPDFAAVRVVIATLTSPQTAEPTPAPATPNPPDGEEDRRFLPATTILKSKKTDVPVTTVKWIITVRPENPITAPRNELIDALQRSVLTVDSKDGHKIHVPEVVIGQKTLRDGGAAWRREHAPFSNERHEEQLVVTAQGVLLFQRATFRDDLTQDILLVSFIDLALDVTAALMVGSRYGGHLHLDAPLKASLLLKVPSGYSKVAAHFGKGIVKSTSPMSTGFMFESEVEGSVVLEKSISLDAIAMSATRLLNYAAAAFARDDADELLSIDPPTVQTLCGRLNGSRGP